MLLATVVNNYDEMNINVSLVFQRSNTEAERLSYASNYARFFEISHRQTLSILILFPYVLDIFSVTLNLIRCIGSIEIFKVTHGMHFSFET